MTLWSKMKTAETCKTSCYPWQMFSIIKIKSKPRWLVTMAILWTLLISLCGQPLVLEMTGLHAESSSHKLGWTCPKQLTSCSPSSPPAFCEQRTKHAVSQNGIEPSPSTGAWVWLKMLVVSHKRAGIKLQAKRSRLPSYSWFMND